MKNGLITLILSLIISLSSTQIARADKGPKKKLPQDCQNGMVSPNQKQNSDNPDVASEAGEANNTQARKNSNSWGSSEGGSGVGVDDTDTGAIF